MTKTVSNLLEQVIEKRPADVKATFKELMVDYMREAVEERKQYVTENLFAKDESEEEEESSLNEISADTLKRAYYKQNRIIDKHAGYTKSGDLSLESDPPPAKKTMKQMQDRADKFLAGIVKRTK